MSSAEDLRTEITRQRQSLRALESELLELEASAGGETWRPERFYLAYYVLAGMVLGMVAAWVGLGLNVLGAMALGMDDPLKLLRVYSTIIRGADTESSREAVVLAFAIGLHTITGMFCGAPIHVVLSRWFPKTNLVKRIVVGVVLGLIMWIVNFYCLLSWIQPLFTGAETSYIVENIPWYVAAGTHVAFTTTIVLLQPLAVFTPAHYRRAA